MELKDYRALVKRLAAERSGETVFNGSADHATIIIENLFASANANVRLLTGDLSARVYGGERVVQQAKQFLGHSDHTLEVIVEKENFSKSHPFVEALRDNANVIFYKLKTDVSEKLPYHFMTVDNDCFRFEREKNTHAAVAAFGDSATASHLNNLFSSLVKLSDKVDIHALAD